MKIETLQVGILETNCYIVYDEESGKACVFDPGAEADRILDFIAENKLSVEHIILTHGHFDHMLAANRLQKELGAKVVVHEDDLFMLSDGGSNFYMSIAREPFRPLTPNIILRSNNNSLLVGKTLLAGNEVAIYHTPGHSPGSCCIFIDNAIFTGDTLMYRTVGRTDLTRGNDRAMASSLQVLYGLEYDYIIYPGHGKQTTLANEKRENMAFLAYARGR